MLIACATEVTQELEEAIRLLMPQLTSYSPAPGRKEIGEIVKSPCVSLLYARPDEDKGIVAMLSLVTFRTPTGMHAWIEDVVVDEKWRGQGIGEALTQAGIERAIQRGASSVDLTSRPTREAANQLYLKMGFELRHTNLYRYTPSASSD